MRQLLKAGANIDGRTKGFATPLHIAASAGQIESIKFLAQAEDYDGRRADLLAEDAATQTPWVLANRTGHTVRPHPKLLLEEVSQLARACAPL
jgi:hypothetical protein